MAINKRKAEKENDTKTTLGDLIYHIEHWNREKMGLVAEEQTYQRDNFVPDFFRDPSTMQYSERLKYVNITYVN